MNNVELLYKRKRGRQPLIGAWKDHWVFCYDRRTVFHLGNTASCSLKIGTEAESAHSEEKFDSRFNSYETIEASETTRSLTQIQALAEETLQEMRMAYSGSECNAVLYSCQTFAVALFRKAADRPYAKTESGVFDPHTGTGVGDVVYFKATPKGLRSTTCSVAALFCMFALSLVVNLWFTILVYRR